MSLQFDLFSLSDRYDALSQSGDPLEKLNKMIDWTIFDSILKKALEKERKSNAGRKAFDSLMMFKVLVVQALYNLSDGQMEYQIKDRLSFMRFLGLRLSEGSPDEKTIWAFREQLKNLGVLNDLFQCFEGFLNGHGFKASIGQMVDAKIVEIPKQRNTREENAQIKEGEIPEIFEANEHRLAQKDVDARWIKKRGQNYYGYKNHVNADAKFKLIRAYEVTSANQADNSVFLDILRPAEEGQEKVWADNAYFSFPLEKQLTEKGYQSRVIDRCTHHLSESSLRMRENYRRAKVRKRVEHVFGFMVNTMRGGVIRGIGLARAKFNIGLRNLVYNLCRYEQLQRLGVS